MTNVIADYKIIIYLKFISVGIVTLRWVIFQPKLERINISYLYQYCSGSIRLYNEDNHLSDGKKDYSGQESNKIGSHLLI